MNDNFMDTMMFRHACKEFDPEKKIDNETFNKILQYGQWSPSSFGFEPWKFLVIQDKNLREKLKNFTWGAQGQLPTASHYVIILARKKPSMIYNSSYIDMMLKKKELPDEIYTLYTQLYKKFQKSDFELLKSDEKIFDWACKQTYIAMANMMTGAASLQIDSCPIEGFDQKQMEDFLQNKLQIDTNEFGVSVMVAFGYRKTPPQRKRVRQELDEITQWF